MIKRISYILLTIILVLSMSFSLFACFGNDSNNNSNNDNVPNDGGGSGDNNEPVVTEQILDAKQSYDTFNIAWTAFDVTNDVRFKVMQDFTSTSDYTSHSEVTLELHNKTQDRVVDYISDGYYILNGKKNEMLRHVALFKNFKKEPIFLVQEIKFGYLQEKYFYMDDTNYSKSVASINNASSIMYTLIDRVPTQFNTQSKWSGVREVATDKIMLKYDNEAFHCITESGNYDIHMIMEVVLEDMKITSITIKEIEEKGSLNSYTILVEYDIEYFLPYDYESCPYGGYKDWFDFSSL